MQVPFLLNNHHLLLLSLLLFKFKSQLAKRSQKQKIFLFLPEEDIASPSVIQ